MHGHAHRYELTCTEEVEADSSGSHVRNLYSYGLCIMAYVVMAYVVIANVVMAYVVMAYVAMAHVVMACVVMASSSDHVPNLVLCLH